jgi:peptide-methionine (S)-S-oxide reductase
MTRMRSTILIVGTICVAAAYAISYHRAPNPATTQRATFAAGCFWGVEATFREFDGVISTRVGYAGGHVDRPSYKDLCYGASGHAETVQVEFDPARVSYAQLLDAFWSCHDPTRPRNGAEPQRSIIFAHDDQQRRIAAASRDEVDASSVFERRIATEIRAATDFFPAEEYHQQYLAKLGIKSRCTNFNRTVRTRLAARAAEPLDR